VSRLTQHSGSRDELDSGATVEIEGKTYPDYIGIGIAYAELIANETIPACRLLILSAKRFLRMYQDAQSGKGEFYWSPEHAIEPCAFIETLTHVKGVLAKANIRLEAWQIWIVIAIYGFRWTDTGDRVVNIAQLEITRKQGKSLLAAGLALYELGPNAYIGDDLYIIAPTAALAQKVLEPMRKMVEYNPSLKEHYGISVLNERIDVAETESYAVILSSSGKKQDGHDPKVVIADEFHSLPASIFNVMKSSQGARPESLFLEIGSAGYNAFGVGWDERNLAIEVLEGKRERYELFVAIWTIDTEDFGNWRSERVIRKCNPNFGISTPKRKVLQEVEEIYTNPRNKNETLRTRFNIWGLGESKLISRDAWDLCEDKSLTLELAEGAECWIGVDLATRNDMVCWVAEFELSDGSVAFFAKHYVPEVGPWREDEEVRDIYEKWHEEHWLTFTPGSHHTYEEIEKDLLDFCDNHDVKLIVVDDREANALMGALTKKGKPVVSHRKNAPNYSEPTKDIVARATGKIKSLVHNGNPVLAWNVENVIGAYNTAELVLPKKISEHSNQKIDGFDSMVMAHSAYLEQVDGSKVRRPNPMTTRGMRVPGEGLNP
jgi:phage terminase large subunit-like protein